jgi:hypothetical protein
LIEKLEYEGEWWFPQQPSEKIRGTLTFTPEEGPLLNLLIFEADVGEIEKKPTELILGFSANGKKITLHKCLNVKTSSCWSNAGVNAVRFSLIPSFVFIGVHFQTPSEILFNKMSTQFLYLDEWVAVSGFKISHPSEKFEVKYKLPKDFEFNINKELSLRIKFSISYPERCHPQVKVNIKQSVSVVFSPSTPRTLDYFLNLLLLARNFLTLAMSEPTYPTAIEAESESEKIKLNEKEFCTPIQVVFQQYLSAYEPSKTIHDFRMLFTLKDIAKQKRVLKNWFKKAELLEPVCSLYFGTLYQKGMYLNNELLNLAQALEAYHRRTMINLELPIKGHQKRISQMLQAAPAEHREWLKNKLKYSNEPTLRKRLKDIWKECPDAISSQIGNQNEFIGLTVDTRNYLTHFDDELKTNAATGNELYRLVMKLRILIQTCLLKELQFEDKDIERIMLKPLRQLEHLDYGPP